MIKKAILLCGLAAFTLACVCRPMAARADDTDKPIKALFICGGCCHDYKHQKDIITAGISARANVEWTIAYDPISTTGHLNPIYEKDDWYAGFDVIVHDECSADVKDPAVIEKILAPHKKGLPAVTLHCAMHCFRAAPYPKTTAWMEFTGLNTNHHGAQIPIDITFNDPESPITKGMANWQTIHEELYHQDSLIPTSHALATGKQEKDGKQVDSATVVWTNDYHGTRVFSTTIGHNNETCSDARYLNMLARGLLWAVNKLDEKHLKPAAQVLMDGASNEPLASKNGSFAAPSGKSVFAPDAQGLAPIELARGKTATASSTQGENAPANAVDDSEDTRWCASDGAFPQWLLVDLGQAHNLRGCRISWENEAAYMYSVEGSADGKQWLPLAAMNGPDAAQNKDHIREHAFIANAAGVRYVRLNVTGADPGCWASVTDFEVYSQETAKVHPIDAKAGLTRDDAKILGKVKAPAGFDMTVFAAPPDITYPTCVATAPGGTVFIGVDKDGSLGKKPDMGWVVRCIDSTGSGKADKFNIFAKMDHPRGLIWDEGKLFVLHPPFLSVYYDDGTGKAGKSEDLVTGISNEKMVESRGADHTTNGIRLGIDGWIYIAVGDFGCFHAKAKDGTELQFHAGGILRIRPDGTGFEVYSWGHRNIYDVSVDPVGNVFTRDNTNDGDAWNDRLAYIVPTGYYGYPSKFMHFPGEFIDCLNDYGGGAPCGSIFIDEPSLPAGWNHDLLTVEWGNSAIYRHPLTPQGAGYQAPTPQEKLMTLPRGTDIDVDGIGHVYATSWANGGFNYSTPTVGYVIRLTPTGAKPMTFPDMHAASDEQLLGLLASGSGVCRLTAQREILHRGNHPTFADGLEKLAASKQPIEARAAAVYTLKLLLGDGANASLSKLAAEKDLREIALRAMCDKKNDVAVSAQPYLSALNDPNPRIRLVAAWGLGRLGKADAASSLVPLLADPDFLVSHIAENALAALHASDVCLNAVDDSSPKLAVGALRVLQTFHEIPVVQALGGKLAKAQSPVLRGEILSSICRLHFREADWDASWWGTRPDRTGPYYKNAEWGGTAKVREILQSAIASEKPEVVRSLVISLEKHQIDLPGLSKIMAELAMHDPESANQLLDQLSTKRDLTEEQLDPAAKLAQSATQPPAVRVKAIRILASNKSGQEAAFATLAGIITDESTAKAAVDPALSAAVEEYVRDLNRAKSVKFFAKAATSGAAAGHRELADAVLLNLAASHLVKPAVHTEAGDEVAKGWEKPELTVDLLRAIARTHATGYDDRIKRLTTNGNAQVAQAANDCLSKMGSHPVAVVPTADQIETVGYETTVAKVLKDKGDAALGKELFTRQGCVACHTITPDQPPKGPMLGGITARYNRSELCESIMKPSAKIAQGFETQWFKTDDGDVLEGFVVREGGDDLELRNIAGVSTTLKKSEIKDRGKRDKSVMPEGLVAKLAPHDLASIIAYLETLKVSK